MAWVFPFHNSAQLKTAQRSKRSRFGWALLCVGLSFIGPGLGFADEALPLEPNLTFDPDPQPFTTAQLRVLYQLIDQAKQRVTPEYYLSEEYLNETSVESAVARRDFARQTKWKQAALERKRVRDEHIAERDANRARIRRLRDQELSVQRLQREAQVARHRQEFCTRFQRRARHHQRSRFANRSVQYTHPHCL